MLIDIQPMNIFPAKVTDLRLEPSVLCHLIGQIFCQIVFDWLKRAYDRCPQLYNDMSSGESRGHKTSLY